MLPWEGLTQFLKVDQATALITQSTPPHHGSPTITSVALNQHNDQRFTAFPHTKRTLQRRKKEVVSDANIVR